MNGQTEAGRILAQKIGGGIVGLDSRRALVGAAAVRLSEALDHLRGAFLAEADDEGDFADALIIVQGRIRDAMAGCQATLLGMAEREKKAVPAKGHGPSTENPARR
jgi:hypothetical protein